MQRDALLHPDLWRSAGRWHILSPVQHQLAHHVHLVRWDLCRCHLWFARGRQARSSIRNRLLHRCVVATLLPSPSLTHTGLFFIGVALQTGCHNLAGFAVGRVFAGLGVGGVSCLVPVYQAECAPKQIRGMIVSAFQFFITVGLLIAAVIVDATKNRMDASSFMIPIGVQFIWGAIIAIGICFLPESPRWLMATDRNDKARRSLSRLLSAPEDSKEVTTAYAEIAANLEHERKIGKAGWLDCFKRGESKALQRVTTGMAIQALQQLTGSEFSGSCGYCVADASQLHLVSKRTQLWWRNRSSILAVFYPSPIFHCAR